MSTVLGDAWGSKPRVVLLGSNGRMAKFFCRVLFAEHTNVFGYDLGDEIPANMLSEADILWISVSMDAVDSTIQKYAPMLRSDALICDINGLKMRVTEQYAKLRNPWLSLHPMFGPFVSSLKGQKFLACVSGSTPQSTWVLNKLKLLGGRVQLTDPRSHDFMMALVQVLVHFNKFVLAKTLIEKEPAFLETLEFASPIFRLELSVLSRMFAQSSNLYSQIQTENPFAKEIRDCFVKHAHQLAEELSACKTSGIEELFEVASPYFEDAGATIKETSKNY